MKLEINKLSVLILISLLISSCSNKTQLKFEEYNNHAYNQAMLEKVSYQLINQRVFIPKCISCHGVSGNVNLETYASVYGFIDKIKDVTILSHEMPKSPYSSLNKEELELLATWIQAGAPEKALGGVDIPPPVVEPLEAKFLSIQKNIFQNKCLVCHSPGKEAERVSLNTPQEMIDSPLEIVIPGNPDDSDLIFVISPTARKIMPPKKSGITSLKPEEIEILKQWIANGATD
ncbi:MAG: hypothetical protein H7177_16120 [Rhizobacter sp.]|nr:hypothetical protein [Bacteriovorax sp.]